MKVNKVVLEVGKVLVESAIRNLHLPGSVERETGNAEELAEAIEGEYKVISAS